MKLIVLYPLGRVSRFQQAQMIYANQNYTNATTIAVEGMYVCIYVCMYMYVCMLYFNWRFFRELY